MRIKMLTTSADEVKSRQAGQEYEVSAEEGETLCTRGFAVPVKDAGAETADLKPDENATARMKKKK